MMFQRHFGGLSTSAALLGISLLAAPACVTEPDGSSDPVVSNDGEDGDDYEPHRPGGKADGFGSADVPLTFSGACESGDRITIAAVGDVLLHGRLQRQGFAKGFGSLWAGIDDLLADADVTYANLEGPTAPGVKRNGKSTTDPGQVWDNVVYSSYPQFNYHPALLDGLIASGVDVVSTANNHSLDRRSLGADRTVDELEQRQLAFTGTRRANETDREFFTFTNKGGFRLAWLACTYGTNGIPDPHHQVANCYQDRSELLASVSDLAARSDVDAVMVTPHWGSEYKANPNDKEVDLAHEFLDAGAIAVIGSHPHVTQPWERYVTSDGRETFAIYSLGNFVSGQRHLARRSTLLLQLGLVRTATGVTIDGARYVPLHMSIVGDDITLQAVDSVAGLDDSRNLTTSMYGLYNLAPPAIPVVTNPQCDPTWSAPHPLDGWIGGQCDDDDMCGGTSCAYDLPGGSCTVACDGYCPDAYGRASTFCIDNSDTGSDGGRCVPRCTVDSECRDGYHCETRSRHTQSGVRKSVCVPSE